MTLWLLLGQPSLAFFYTDRFTYREWFERYAIERVHTMIGACIFFIVCFIVSLPTGDRRRESSQKEEEKEEISVGIWNQEQMGDESQHVIYKTWRWSKLWRTNWKITPKWRKTLAQDLTLTSFCKGFPNRNVYSLYAWALYKIFKSLGVQTYIWPPMCPGRLEVLSHALSIPRSWM